MICGSLGRSCSDRLLAVGENLINSWAGSPQSTRSRPLAFSNIDCGLDGSCRPIFTVQKQWL